MTPCPASDCPYRHSCATYDPDGRKTYPGGKTCTGYVPLQEKESA